MGPCIGDCRMVKVGELTDRDGDIVAEQWQCGVCRKSVRKDA